jgi:hypothetical protein
MLAGMRFEANDFFRKLVDHPFQRLHAQLVRISPLSRLGKSFLIMLFEESQFFPSGLQFPIAL